MDPATITAVIAALASTVGLLVTSLRKRQDTTVEELKLRAKTEKDEHEDTKSDLAAEQSTTASLRKQLRLEQNNGVIKDGKIFTLRRILAQHGWPDPTFPDEEETVWRGNPPDLTGGTGNEPVR